MTIARPLALACLLLAGALVAPSARAADAEQAAVAAADAWLKLVDAGKYGESWDGAARFFKGAVAKQDWERAAKGARGPLGKLVFRKVASRTATDSLPGAPDGKYVVVVYEASFENKKRATETVTPMLDADGRWRVSGYYVR